MKSPEPGAKHTFSCLLALVAAAVQELMHRTLVPEVVTLPSWTVMFLRPIANV